MINDFRPPTALHAALEANDDAAAIRAIEAGDDVNSRDSRWSRGQGLTPLHVAAKNNNAAMIAFLIENGAQVDAQSEPGITPLWVACNSRNFRAVQTLLDHGADQSIVNSCKETPHRHVTRIVGEFIAILATLEQRQSDEPTSSREHSTEASIND